MKRLGNRKMVSGSYVNFESHQSKKVLERDREKMEKEWF